MSETEEIIFESDDFESEVDELVDSFGKLSHEHPLIGKALNGTLTKEDMNDLEYTELLRLSNHPAIAEFALKTFNVRGVQIKNEYSLHPHQVIALQWMKMREAKKRAGIRGGLICMKMGMGKTLTALVHMLSSPRGEFPNLVIASKTVLTEWKAQGVDKFFEPYSVKVLFFHKDYITQAGVSQMTREQIAKYDIVLTTYDLCLAINRVAKYYESCLVMGDEHTLMKGKIVEVETQTYKNADKPHLIGAGVLYGTPWNRVICDESQKFANPKTKIYYCVMALYGNYKWCLTGTPIRNYETDIWAQLRFCGYNLVTRSIDWKRNGSIIYKKQNLAEFIYKMDYSDANIVLPTKHLHIIEIEISGEQKEVYDFFLKKAKDIFMLVMAGAVDFACILALFTRLRQCAISPFLTTPLSKRTIEKEKNELLQSLMQDIHTHDRLGKWCFDRDGGSGIYAEKISKEIEILQNIPKGEKVLFFTMFTSYSDLVVKAIEKRMPDYGFLQVDGDTKGRERGEMIKKFKEDPNINLLLLTYKVGGEGLNLTEATHCICGEPWWTNAVHSQAESRIHRSGQQKECHIYYVVSTNTIEKKVLDICKQKDTMAESYLNGTERPLGKVGLDRFTLGQILGVFE